jgi:stress-induced morphogen
MASLALACISRDVHVLILFHTGGCGQSFTSLIVSPSFTGLNSLKRHRLVNGAMREEIAKIHAWSARCQTPDEWERDKKAAEAAAATNGVSEAVPGPPMDGTVGGKVDGIDA